VSTADYRVYIVAPPHGSSTCGPSLMCTC